MGSPGDTFNNGKFFKVWKHPFTPEYERTLVPRLQACETSALGEVALAFAPLFNRMANKFHNLTIEPSELVAMVQARILETEPIGLFAHYTVQPGKHIGNYVSLAARNIMFDQARREKREAKLFVSADNELSQVDHSATLLDTFVSADANPAEVAAQHQSMARLTDAWAALPAMQRTVLACIVLGESHAEIGARLNIVEGTSKTHTMRARNKLKTALG